MEGIETRQPLLKVLFMASKLDVPKFDALMKPTLAALKALGGSASNQELHDWVAEHLALPDRVRSVPHGDRGMTALQYRLHWARSYLKRVGAVGNSEHGVWTITDIGRQMTDAEIAAVKRRVRSQYVAAGAPTRRQPRSLKGASQTRSKQTGPHNFLK